MKIFLFVLAATVLEACGDAILRIALHHPSTAVRVALFFAGAVLLTSYGTSLNLAPVSFASVTGLYVAVLFVVFQMTNYIFFKAVPNVAVMLGGAFIVLGGLIVYKWS